MHDKRQYLEKLTALVRERYRCEVIHRRTAMVHETLADKRTWKGEVEVFFLPNHPTSKRCYVWQTEDGGEFQSVLETPPAVIGPSTAVRAALEKS